MTTDEMKEFKRYLENDWLEVPKQGEPTKPHVSVEYLNNAAMMNFSRIGPFSNWLVLENKEIPNIDELLSAAHRYFEEKKTPFSIALFDSHFDTIEQYLYSKQFFLAETVECMIFETEHFNKKTKITNNIVRVTTEQQLYDAMKIDDSYAEHNEQQFQRSFELNKKRLSDNKYIWWIGLYDNKPVSMVCLEMIPERSIAYLSGATTLEKYRKNGFYTDLLNIRIKYALEHNMSIVATHAVDNTSAPILKKHGFSSISKIKVLQKKDFEIK